MPVVYSYRHARMLKEMSTDNVNTLRSFGAKEFNKKKTRRKMARDSRRINRAS